MYSNKILGQLIALTKEIRLIKPETNKCYESSFFAGNKYPFLPLGGIGITWWYTENGIQLCKNIATMSIDKYEELLDGDKDKLFSTIRDAFCKICLNNEFFNGDDVFLGRKENLFDARTVDDVDIFSKKLWDFILNIMENSIGRWCCVYPLPRLNAESFKIPNENIHLIDRIDKEAWKKFETDFPETKYWDHSTGFFTDDKTSAFGNFNYASILVCINNGTSDGSKFKAKLKFKRFLSALFAILWFDEDIKLQKSSAHPYRQCVQFKSKENKSYSGVIFSEIGELLPNYVSDYKVKNHTVDSLKDWYLNLQNAELEIKNRVNNAAHFINNAMIADGIDEFINYFISLDALFGKRGDVERHIIEGVNNCVSDSLWEQKIRWLYDLRSELVHGGARFEKEWKDFDKYLKHFGTHPFNDVRELAFSCIVKKILPNIKRICS